MTRILVDPSQIKGDNYVSSLPCIWVVVKPEIQTIGQFVENIVDNALAPKGVRLQFLHEAYMQNALIRAPESIHVLRDNDKIELRGVILGPMSNRTDTTANGSRSSNRRTGDRSPARVQLKFNK